ncbi:MAG: NYN domain-containing protein, partial [Spirochaetota bacterium]
AGHIQHVIVVAGDSDFIPAIEATKESGATVTLWYGDTNTIHKDLISVVDMAYQFDPKKLPQERSLLDFGKSRRKEAPNKITL